jgi:hypothetical protein
MSASNRKALEESKLGQKVGFSVVFFVIRKKTDSMALLMFRYLTFSLNQIYYV